MIVLDLFAGTRSISRAFEHHGHKAYSVEWDRNFENISLYADIGQLTAKDVISLCGGHPDIIWASPDCTSYSIAGISHHRKQTPDGKLIPFSDYAKFCDKTNIHLIELIKELKPKYYFIENPRGGLRKMDFMKGIPRYTITYCQYGDSRMKPTDIWTNHPNPKFKPMCKNGDACHDRAPRGSRDGGTQGLKNSMERSIIPAKLCEHIVKICEKTEEPAQKTLANFFKISEVMI